jgi:predicted Ser/Thr protein kinase
MDTQRKCAVCGQPLAENAPDGMCPGCLLKAGFPTGAAIDTETEPVTHRRAFVPPTVAELAPKFPQLEILEFIGQGGMGAVYKARQKELDRLIALKILPPDIGLDAAFAERFTREAKALAKLSHPGIVTIHDTGRADGLYYLVMEYVDGVTLRQLMNAGRISAREALAIVPQICDALQFAHDQGIIHRDIKPENILIDRLGRVKVADFGLAKIVESVGQAVARAAEKGKNNTAPSSSAPHELTEVGKIMGTPQYMSPEQIQAPGDVDHRADIYALGVVFYQMLTGELPGKKIEPPSKKVHIDVRLDEIVLRALEEKPERRYQQASVMKTQVETIAFTPGGGRREEAQTEAQKGSQSLPASAAVNPAPRFSRAAIVGAVCAPLCIISEALFHTAPFVTLTALFVTTITGWMAVSQIRRSAGRLYGMWLAVLDGLLFPVLLLDAGIATLWASLAKQFARSYLHIGDSMFLNLADESVWAFLASASIVYVDWLLFQWVLRTDKRGKSSRNRRPNIHALLARPF